MKVRVLKTSTVVIVLTVFLLWALWYLGVPSGYIRALIEGKIQKELEDKVFRLEGVVYHIKIYIDDLEKALLPGLRIGSLRAVARSDRESIELLNLQDIEISPSAGLLLKGYIGGGFAGKLGTEGRFDGQFRVKGTERQVEIDIETPLKEIRALKTLPVKVEGILKAKVIIEGENFRARFRIRPFKGEGFIKDNLYFPLNLFNEVRGLLELKGNTMKVRSLSLDGDRIYGSFSGQIAGTLLRGVFKIMPEETFPKALLYAIRRYKKAPGLYEIPVNLDLKRLS